MTDAAPLARKVDGSLFTVLQGLKMPARKMLALSRNSKINKNKMAERVAAENSMIPSEELQTVPPARLKGHKTASAMWKKIVLLYSSVEGKVATAFDAGVLEKYCLLEEELIWLEGRRSKMDKDLLDLEKLTAKKPRTGDEDQWKIYLKLLDQCNALSGRLQSWDGRIDNKRKLSLALSMALYLNPRSRAGVAPPTKETEEPEDEIETLLNS